MKYSATQLLNNTALGWCVVDEKKIIFTRGLMCKIDAELLATLLNKCDKENFDIACALVKHNL